MKSILKAKTPIGYIDTPNPTTTNITFDFQVSSNAFGAFFKACDGAFALTITPSSVYIVNEKQVTYLNEPVELQIGKWYSAECGIDTYWILNAYVLYVRIWQHKETYAPKRQSTRRMLVADRRIQKREDVLQRRPVRYRWPKRRPQPSHAFKHGYPERTPDEKATQE